MLYSKKFHGVNFGNRKEVGKFLFLQGSVNFIDYALDCIKYRKAGKNFNIIISISNDEIKDGQSWTTSIKKKFPKNRTHLPDLCEALDFFVILLGELNSNLHQINLSGFVEYCTIDFDFREYEEIQGDPLVAVYTFRELDEAKGCRR